jgi:hypothetical protein
MALLARARREACPRRFLAGSLFANSTERKDRISSFHPRNVVALVGTPRSPIRHAGGAPCRQHIFAGERRLRSVVHRITVDMACRNTRTRISREGGGLR